MCTVCEGYSSTKCPCCGEGVETAICPDCHGTGKTPYLAVNLVTKEIEEVTESAWLIMPEDEDEAALLTARGKKQNYCRCEKGGSICRTCYGHGKYPIED